MVPGLVLAADLGRAIQSGGGKAELATVGGGKVTVTETGDALAITDAKGAQARVAKATSCSQMGWFTSSTRC